MMMNIVNSAIGSRYVVYGLAIGATYVVFALFQVNHFVSTILRGDQHYAYYLTYIPALYLIFCLYGMRRNAFIKFGWSLWFGVIAGYVAGLFAYFAVTFSMGNGFSRIANTVNNVAEAFGVLTLPAIFLSWAYGALAAALVVYLFRRRSIQGAGNGV